MDATGRSLHAARLLLVPTERSFRTGPSGCCSRDISGSRSKHRTLPRRARNIERFRDDGPKSTFRGWLRTVTRSKVADSFRRKGKEPDAAGGTDAQFRFNQLVDQEPVAGQEVEDSAGLSEERRVLFRQALELIQRDFEERTWNAFWKVAVEGRPTADVADELNMKPGTVRVSRCRVLARLREEFGDLIESDEQE